MLPTPSLFEVLIKKSHLSLKMHILFMRFLLSSTLIGRFQQTQTDLTESVIRTVEKAEIFVKDRRKRMHIYASDLRQSVECDRPG